MTTDYLIPLMCSNIRAAIVSIANAFTKTDTQRRDLIVKAWCVVGEADRDKTQDYYIALAYSAMRHYYEVYLMDVQDRYRNDDPANRRAKRKIRKFIKKSGVK